MRCVVMTAANPTLHGERLRTASCLWRGISGLNELVSDRRWHVAATGASAKQTFWSKTEASLARDCCFDPKVVRFSQPPSWPSAIILSGHFKSFKLKAVRQSRTAIAISGGQDRLKTTKERIVQFERSALVTHRLITVRKSGVGLERPRPTQLRNYSG